MLRQVVLPNFDKRAVVVCGEKDGVPFETRTNGVVTVIAQDSITGEVLMVAYTDKAGYLETLATGLAVYLTTSRGGKRWLKGGTSGNTQKVVEVLVDCDSDAVILKVEPQGDGVACHTNARSCFYRNAVGGTILMTVPKLEDGEKIALVDAEVCDGIAVTW